MMLAYILSGIAVVLAFSACFVVLMMARRHANIWSIATRNRESIDRHTRRMQKEDEDIRRIDKSISEIWQEVAEQKAQIRRYLFEIEQKENRE